MPCRHEAETGGEAERAAATEGLRQGGLVAKAVAEYLKVRYERSGAAHKAPAPVTSGAPATGTPSGGALSPREYVQAVEAARKTYRGKSSFEDSQEYRSLQDRRRAYRPA